MELTKKDVNVAFTALIHAIRKHERLQEKDRLSAYGLRDLKEMKALYQKISDSGIEISTNI